MNETSVPVIKVENLVKRYGTNYALNDISFEIGEGEIVGLLGPNGAGKSTTMNILTGYLSSSSGAAYINGIDILENPLEAKKFIGFLPEQPPIYPEMTVAEYLNFVYELKCCKLDRDPHIEEILSVVKLTDVKDRLIRNLSKGYKQRVGIAQALIGDPKIIIFDEPTVGLDPKQILEVRNLIRMLGRRHTVILSTHILAEVQAVCERVIIINKGQIIANERTEDITRTIEGGYRYEAKICAQAKDVLPALRAQGAIKNAEATGAKDGDAYVYVVESAAGVDARKAVFTACADNRFPLIGLAPIGTDLESIFINLVDRSDAQGADKKLKAKKAH
ncbi:MAG: ATP-binding cassette domain-containing protein [Clostridia bacterium]|nr:ATP-binding cassette domain-containing protein [Clostridia bacterium]